jgi:cell division protease FtsH
MFVSVYRLFTDTGEKDKDKSVKDLVALITSPEEMKNVEKVVVQPRGNDSAKYVVHYNNGTPKTVVLGPYAGGGNDLTEALNVSGIAWTVEPKEKSTFWESLIISWLPLVFILVIFIFFMRQLQGGGGKAMNFGKSKAKLLSETQAKITFKDVAGIEEAKEEVEEIIAFLKDPKKFTRLGGRIPKGVLLMGSPGTGKTLLARAIAGEASVPFFSISGSDFVEMFVGVGASRVRDLFEQGKKNAPCIIFIDEIDAVGRHRGAGLGGGHDEREQTLNQLLVEMDGFESNDGVILVAATNRPDVLDPALLRPGRFDRRINVPRPDVNGRLGILKVHTRKVPMDKTVVLNTIAKGSPGFSGADLENLVNEAALLAARRDKDRVEMDDFEDAKDKVLMGAERRSLFISEKEKRNTAMHEAGHALVACLIGGEQVDPLHKVTIIPRGRALGLTQQLPTEDRLSMTREYTLNRICILMGGRCAEEIMFDQRTTGAGNDIEQASNLARKMVTEWGMSELIGPLNYGGGGQEVFLGREMTQKSDNCSEETAKTIDQEVRRIVQEQYQRAVELLTSHRSNLEAVGESLLEHETLNGAEIKTLMEGGVIERQSPASTDAESEEPESGEKKRASLFPPIRPVGKKDPDPEPA